MSHDIPDQNQHPTGDGIAHPTNPSEDLTNAFNALFYAAYTRLQGGLPKLEMMRFLERHRQALTTYAVADEENFFTRFNPFALQYITEQAAEPKPYDCQDLALIMPEVVALQDLHRDRCTDHTHPHGGGPCFQCGRTEAEIQGRSSGETCGCNCHTESDPLNIICRCGCDGEPATVLQDGYGIAPRLCHCGEEALDQTGDCAPYCSAACAENEPAGWDYTTNADPCPAADGGHWGNCDECLNGPATASTENEPTLELVNIENGPTLGDRTSFFEQMGCDPERIGRRVLHVVNAAVNMGHTSFERLFLGFDSVDCPFCGCALEFTSEDGFHSQIDVSCDCYGTVSL